MLVLLVYTFCAFGLAYCLGSSKISLLYRSPLASLAKSGLQDGAKPKQMMGGAVASFFLTLIECPACTGFWIGVVFARTDIGRDLITGSLWITGWILGLWTVATNLILARLAGLTSEES